LQGFNVLNEGRFPLATRRKSAYRRSHSCEALADMELAHAHNVQIHRLLRTRYSDTSISTG
jgi:hypothetical protein